MLTNYVLILANTGIRVGEARKLKWSDIVTFVADDEKDNIILEVKGKTGAREVVAAQPFVKDYLHHIWELRCKELNGKPPLSEVIFCHKNGAVIYSFKKGFNALIKEADVEFDTNGQRRVIYSLRHTYATFRLHEGVNAYTLARNMGTSVKMLEAFYGHTSNRAMASELTKTRANRESSSHPAPACDPGRPSAWRRSWPSRTARSHRAPGEPARLSACPRGKSQAPTSARDRCPAPSACRGRRAGPPDHGRSDQVLSTMIILTPLPATRRSMSMKPGRSVTKCEGRKSHRRDEPGAGRPGEAAAPSQSQDRRAEVPSGCCG